MLFTRKEFRPYQACVLDLVPFTLDRLNRKGINQKMRIPKAVCTQAEGQYEGIGGVGSELS
jgi:hypothetical protein